MLQSLNFYRKLPKDIKQEIKKFKENDITIDIGANVGVITWIFAFKKCLVIAIEPHPMAFHKLRKSFRNMKNVTLMNAAVSIEKNNKVKLFLHSQNHADSIKFAQGSSLRSDKPNVGMEYIEVANINPLDLFENLTNIRAIKIDIEGYEVELLPYLLESGKLAQVESIFVELHDRKWPSLSEHTRLMIKMFEDNSNHGKIFWNWP
jgi:FkbM family methyltransferase